VTITAPAPGGVVAGAHFAVLVTVAAAAPGSGTPTGTASLLRNGASVAGPQSLSNGATTFTVADTLSPGSYAYTVAYSGDTNFQASSVPVTIIIHQDASTTTLKVANAPVGGIFNSVEKILTATVSPIGPHLSQPTGSIAFYDGTRLIGTVPLGKTEAASLTAEFAPGTHTLRAIYKGDASFVSTSSAPVIIIIPGFHFGLHIQ
jgi:hypothetical protein